MREDPVGDGIVVGLACIAVACVAFLAHYTCSLCVCETAAVTAAETAAVTAAETDPELACTTGSASVWRFVQQPGGGGAVALTTT